MNSLLQPWQLLLLILAGWINHREQDVIEYLRAENRVLREKLGKKRILLNDNQRRRLKENIGFFDFKLRPVRAVPAHFPILSSRAIKGGAIRIMDPRLNSSGPCHKVFEVLGEPAQSHLKTDRE